MQFLAIVWYGHGHRMIHEFRCPLERRAFLKQLEKSDPKAVVKLRQVRDVDDYPPEDEAHWYQGRRAQR